MSQSSPTPIIIDHPVYGECDVNELVSWIDAASAQAWNFAMKLAGKLGLDLELGNIDALRAAGAERNGHAFGRLLVDHADLLSEARALAAMIAENPNSDLLNGAIYHIIVAKTVPSRGQLSQILALSK